MNANTNHQQCNLENGLQITLLKLFGHKYKLSIDAEDITLRSFLTLDDLHEIKRLIDKAIHYT